MGTSTARRSPSTAAWRFAKGAATRYLSPEGGTPVTAREVVRRYVAALEDTHQAQGQDLLAGFRLARKAAQPLGEFGDLAAHRGLAAALEIFGLKTTEPPFDQTVLALTDLWVEDDGSLEAAVARSALGATLTKLCRREPEGAASQDGASLVWDFLSRVWWQHLALDLGESLEAAAPDSAAFREALAGLAAEVTGALAAAAARTLPPERWSGLAGWTYVTEILKNFSQDLNAPPASGQTKD